MAKTLIDCAIVNTGSGNLTSLSKAIEKIGKTVAIVDNADAFYETNFQQIIIPGQGRFAAVMKTLNENGLSSILDKWHQSTKPILGICVGMQIFFNHSEEDKDINGFAWISGKIEKLNFPKHPMVGWAKIEPVANFLSPGHAYFVNSFALKKSSDAIAISHYGETFCSALKRKNLVGLQFHPEKSSQYGLEVLKRCLVC